MADYDGITEREAGKTKMPLGMIILFWGLVVFGLLYLYLFTPLFSGWTQVGRYERQVKRVAALAEVIEEAGETAEIAKAVAEKGREIYMTHCALCHGKKLEGGLGPALIGTKLVYGPLIADHIRIITTGTQRGMPKFEKQLGAEKIRLVAHYIHEKREQH